MARSLDLAVWILVLLLGGAFMLRRMITDAMLFFPTRGQARTPSSLGITYEELWLQADDGVRLQAWWMPGAGAGPVLLMLHGNAGTMADRLDNVVHLLELGCSVMAVEYRGYGDSEGKPSEGGLNADALAALTAARAKAGDRPLVVFGRSLGGAVALAVADPRRCEGVIVESTFTSLSAMAARTGIPLAGRLVAYSMDSLARVRTLEVPLLVIHGEADELVPVEMGAALARAAVRSPDVRWVPIPQGPHNGLWAMAGQPYWRAWTSFLGSLRGPRADAP